MLAGYNIIHLTYSSCTIVFCSAAFMGWKSGGVVVSRYKNAIALLHDCHDTTAMIILFLYFIRFVHQIVCADTAYIIIS